MIRRLIYTLRGLRHYVIADATDNSVTFSRALFRRMQVMKLKEAKVFVFRIKDSCEYGFTVNPPIGQETQLADIMVNDKYHCIGFECLVPTVNRIFFDYGLPAGSKCKLSVERSMAENGLVYWRICAPACKNTSER